MQVQINSPKNPVPAAFEEFIHERLHQVLGSLVDQLTRVEVHLQDLAGNKGGLDQRCALEARPRGMDPIAVEAIAADSKEALRLAVEKLKKAVERRMDKRATRQRGS